MNEAAASEMRRSEYLSAVHCADSAAAMAMPPVLGLREAAELTQRARRRLLLLSLSLSLSLAAILYHTDASLKYLLLLFQACLQTKP